MDVEERAHNESLLQIYTGHLRQLEIMAAKYGDLAVPSHVTLEIEEYRRKIANLEARLRSPVTSRSAEPRHNLPPRDYERFVGRQKELAEVRRLLSSRSRAFVVTIDGIGGIGKSALALETAYVLVDQYAELPAQERFEAIVWVSAKRTYLTAGGIRERRQVFRTLEDVFAAIARVLDYPAIPRARPEEQRTIVEQVLREQRTLLILDNLETVDDDGLMDFLHELPEPTKALVTTRYRIDVARPVRLTGMSHEDALALIRLEGTRKDAILPQEQNEELWRRTGGMPLAIVWSIGLMGLGSSVESVLSRLGSGQSDIARFCFGESVAQIRDHNAHRLLLALSLFADDASREALGAAAGFVKFDDDGRAVWTDEFGRDTGLEKLLQLSLVNKLGERFSLLPLTRSFVMSEAPADYEAKQQAKEGMRKYYNQLVRTSGGWTDDWRGHDLVENELPNLLATAQDALSDVCYEEISDSERRVAQKSYPHVRWLLKFIPQIARTCRIRGYWNECEQLCLMAIGLAKAIGEPKRVGWSCYDIGRISQYRGDLDRAWYWATEALVEWQRVGYVTGICQARRVLGIVALRRGDITNAATLITSAYEEYMKTESRSGLPHYLGSLAELAEQQGNLERARELYVQTVELLRQKNDTPYLASDLRNLGRVLFASGAKGEAQECLQEGLRLALDCGRKDVMAKTHFQLAVVYEHQRELPSAETNSRQALDLFRRLGMKREQTEAEALLARLAEGPQSS